MIKGKNISRYQNIFLGICSLAMLLTAYFYPPIFIKYKYTFSPCLMLITFILGITLTLKDFELIFKNPTPLLIGILLQFLLMPVIALVLVKALNLPAELSAGFLLIGCCAGASTSNVICYLTKGNVALSITMTLLSTLAGLVVTPLFMQIISFIDH